MEVHCGLICICCSRLVPEFWNVWRSAASRSGSRWFFIVHFCQSPFVRRRSASRKQSCGDREKQRVSAEGSRVWAGFQCQVRFWLRAITKPRQSRQHYDAARRQMWAGVARVFWNGHTFPVESQSRVGSPLDGGTPGQLERPTKSRCA